MRERRGQMDLFMTWTIDVTPKQSMERGEGMEEANRAKEGKR